MAESPAFFGAKGAMRACTALALALAVLVVLPQHSAAVGIGAGGSAECPCGDFGEGKYGTGCAAHDLVGGPFNTSCLGDISTVAQWCRDVWCYVNKSLCTVRNDLSALPKGVWTDGEWYSYATCGYTNSYFYDVQADKLNGAELRTHFLNNPAGWKGNKCGKAGPASCVGDMGSGPLLTLLRNTSMDSGFIMKEMPTFPPAVMSAVERMDPNMNAFDICALATSLGFFDLCVGSYQLSPERVLLSRYFTLYEEPTYLIVPILDSTKTISDYFMYAFMPLSSDLWFAVIGTVVPVSIIIAIMETGKNGEIAGDSFLTAFIFGMYRAVLSLVTGRSVFKPRTKGGKIASVGLSVLVILMLISYAAKLASFLVLHKLELNDIYSLDDVIANNVPICALTGDDKLLMQLGVKQSQIVVKRVRSEILSAIPTTCKAAAMLKEDFEDSRRGGAYCELTRRGDPLWVVRMGMPMSDEITTSLGTKLTQALFQGAWENSLARYSIEDVCGNSVGENDNELKPLDAWWMAGPLIIAGTLGVIGVIVHCGGVMARPAVSDREQLVAEKSGMNPLRRNISGDKKKYTSEESDEESAEAHTSVPIEDLMGAGAGQAADGRFMGAGGGGGGGGGYAVPTELLENLEELKKERETTIDYYNNERKILEEKTREVEELKAELTVEKEDLRKEAEGKAREALHAQTAATELDRANALKTLEAAKELLAQVKHVKEGAPMASNHSEHHETRSPAHHHAESRPSEGERSQASGGRASSVPPLPLHGTRESASSTNMPSTDMAETSSPERRSGAVRRIFPSLNPRLAK